MGTIKDKGGRDLVDTEEIKKRWNVQITFPSEFVVSCLSWGSGPILGALLLVLVLIILVLISPDLLGDPDKYAPANPLAWCPFSQVPVPLL